MTLDAYKSGCYIHHRCEFLSFGLKNCRFSKLGIQYRVVAGIILKMIIIGNFKKVLVIIILNDIYTFSIIFLRKVV